MFTGHNGQIITSWKRSWLRRCAFQYLVDKAEAVVALSNAEAKYHGSGKGTYDPQWHPPDVFRASGSLRKQSAKPQYDVLYVGSSSTARASTFCSSDGDDSQAAERPP